jgi:hypothetical protein
MNPQERIKKQIEFCNDQLRLLSKMEFNISEVERQKILYNKRIDKLKQELKDLNNMGKRQFRGGKHG